MIRSLEFASEIEDWSLDGFHNSGYTEKEAIQLFTYGKHLEECTECQAYFDKKFEKVKQDYNLTGNVLEELYLGFERRNTSQALEELRKLVVCSIFTTELLCPACNSTVEVTELTERRYPIKEYYCSNKACENEEARITFPLLKLEKKPPKPVVKQMKLF